ncbi:MULTISPECIES: glycosyltransferase [unclassified Paenibacillus]|uniref:glycosyltransferase n=1 Tax=unclassified Paenibacillus TaxID=185978 RepID=UPI001C1076D2|nr:MULTISPECIES: glycosyltransferase [unclassified Paenibacillus]MBU5440828.1 glycosyltransferase [Paenibacillus sp. MSJ-34]CAH0118475.1 Putative teichuronic acid biosynthesis glycosyltransferase TuaG [Paenibacillus sp. CECT 9249]
MKPRVTIVIPFYNCPYVDQAIRSALNQSYNHIEIIVVDDGSTQHTELIAPYRSQLNYLGKANGGTASALNHGIRMASGEYIAWLSSDDLFYRNKIEQQLEFMLSRNAKISYTSFDNIDAHGNVTEADVGIRFPNALEFYRSWHHYNPVNGCTVMMKKSMLERVGLFNESYPYTHDVDLWMRIILKGYYFYFLNKSLTGYRWHNEMGTRKHQPAVVQEYAQTRERYHAPLSNFIAKLVNR